MNCMDCSNKTRFFELNGSADLLVFKEDGTLDHRDSGDDYFEGFECAECGSRDVRENN